MYAVSLADWIMAKFMFNLVQVKVNITATFRLHNLLTDFRVEHFAKARKLCHFTVVHFLHAFSIPMYMYVYTMYIHMYVAKNFTGYQGMRVPGHLITRQS